MQADPAQHLGLARSRAAYWLRRDAVARRMGWDDVLSETTYALVRACRKYDPAKSRLSHYAFPWMDSCVRSAIRKELRSGLNAESLEASVVDRECAGQGRTAAPDLSILPPALRDVIRLRFLEGQEYREIGRELGISHETVRNREREALCLLRTNEENTWH